MNSIKKIKIEFLLLKLYIFYKFLDYPNRNFQNEILVFHLVFFVVKD
jgi:hypothetical protein